MMRIWGKLAVAAAAPLMLTGCLWGPGKFTSNLALNKAGTFVLDYQGEIMFRLPDENSKVEPWSEDFAVCYLDGRITASSGALSVEIPGSGAREVDPGLLADCSDADLSRLKAEYEKKATEKRAEQEKEAEDKARMFGLPGTDDESNRRFAATLMKYQGWRSVSYRGKGLFDVDYHLEGRLTQDFAFPMMPGSDMLIPFVMLRRRADGSVLVTAPALTGEKGPFGARAKMLGLPDKGGEASVSRAEGRFTVTTDGEFLTNNSEDGPVSVQGRRQIRWDVGPGSEKVPEMLVRL